MLWFLEHGVFGDEHPLTEAATRAGHRVMRWDDEFWSSPERMPDAGGRLVFHGCLDNADKIAKLGRWTPGAYCSTEGFACSSWRDVLADYLLNKDAVLTTVRHLVKNSEHLREQFGPRVFVRPDSPLKPFSGRVVTLTGLIAAHLDHGFYYDDLDLHVLVSPMVADLGREWRFLVCHRKLVTHSEYVADGRFPQDGSPSADVLRMADHIATSFDAPDPVYVLDVVETHAGPRLLEVNPFSGADLYRCDLDAVVAAVEGAGP